MTTTAVAYLRAFRANPRDFVSEEPKEIYIKVPVQTTIAEESRALGACYSLPDRMTVTAEMTETFLGIVSL